mgnify:CR=1 FL=1
MLDVTPVEKIQQCFDIQKEAFNALPMPTVATRKAWLESEIDDWMMSKMEECNNDHISVS